MKNKITTDEADLQPLTMKAWVHEQVSPCGIMVNKVALGQVFFKVLWFSPVHIIPRWLSSLICHPEDEQ
jgi:hypothetical protein